MSSGSRACGRAGPRPGPEYQGLPHRHLRPLTKARNVSFAESLGWTIFLAIRTSDPEARLGAGNIVSLRLNKRLFFGADGGRVAA
jgi:hypothetical protein